MFSSHDRRRQLLLTGHTLVDPVNGHTSRRGSAKKVEGLAMLGWAVTFLIIAIIAAILGFGGIAGGAATIAKVLFVLFLILFVVSLFMGRRPKAL